MAHRVTFKQFRHWRIEGTDTFLHFASRWRISSADATVVEALGGATGMGGPHGVCFATRREAMEVAAEILGIPDPRLRMTYPEYYVILSSDVQHIPIFRRDGRWKISSWPQRDSPKSLVGRVIDELADTEFTTRRALLDAIAESAERRSNAG